MKKIIIAVVALIFLVGVGLAGYKAYHHFTKQPTGAIQTTSNSVFGSIKDALSKNLTLQCSFTDQTGRQTTSYIKHGQIRADIVASDPKQSGSVIVKDKTVYFWNGTTGMMMALPDEAETGSTVKTAGGPTPASNEGTDMMATIEQYKDHCKPAVVDDSLFTPPTAVKFQDLSKMMPSGIPTGMMPTGVNQQQLQQYMQQYQQK